MSVHGHRTYEAGSRDGAAKSLASLSRRPSVDYAMWGARVRLLHEFEPKFLSEGREASSVLPICSATKALDFPRFSEQ